jgi:hypothetical protein
MIVTFELGQVGSLRQLMATWFLRISRPQSINVFVRQFEKRFCPKEVGKPSAGSTRAIYVGSSPVVTVCGDAHVERSAAPVRGFAGPLATFCQAIIVH